MKSKSRGKRARIQLLVPVEIYYTTPEALKDAVREVKENLYLQYSSAGGYWFTAETKRPRLIKKGKPT